MVSSGRTLTWDEFKKMFLQHYFPPAIRVQNIRIFNNLKQGSMSVGEYYTIFLSLGCFVPSTMADETVKMVSFKGGLNSQIQSKISENFYANCDQMYEASLDVEQDILQEDEEMRQRRNR